MLALVHAPHHFYVAIMGAVVPGRVLLSHPATYTAGVSCGDNPTARARPMPCIRPRAPPRKGRGIVFTPNSCHWQETSSTIGNSQPLYIPKSLVGCDVVIFFCLSFCFRSIPHVDLPIWAVCMGLSLTILVNIGCWSPSSETNHQNLKSMIHLLVCTPAADITGPLSFVEDRSAIILRGFSFSLEE